MRKPQMYDMFSSHFKEIEATVDSGAARTAFPKNTFQAFVGYKDSDTTCRVANGELVHSAGTATVGVYTEDGAYQELTGELMDVHKILISVAAIVDKGHEVIFDPAGSYIQLYSGKRVPMRRRNDVYTLTLYDAMCFGRQGHRL